MLYYLGSDISRSLPCLEPFHVSWLKSGAIPRFLVLQSRAALPELLIPQASRPFSCPHFSQPSLCLSHSHMLRICSSLPFHALAMYLHEGVPAPHPFFTGLMNTSKGHFHWGSFPENPRPGCMPRTLSYYTLIPWTALQCKCWFTCQFPPSLLCLLRTRNLVLYIFVLTIPRYKNLQKKKKSCSWRCGLHFMCVKRLPSRPMTRAFPATSCLWMYISGMEYYTTLKVKYNQGYKQQHGWDVQTDSKCADWCVCFQNR